MTKERSLMIQYACNSCGTGFRLRQQPICCPFCGSKELTYHTTSKQTALQLVQQVNAWRDEEDAKYEEFLALHVKIENTMQTLRVYKKRGIISEEEMPRPFKKKRLDIALKEYRAKMRIQRKENPK